ncbi:MAG TPA: Ig-like domain-containing protein [Clostridia bacterium]|nr:Ig-like domain-containing protein [Clostridia bacterium]
MIVFKRVAQRVAFIAMTFVATASIAIAGTVTISTPTTGQNVGSPFHVVASASSSHSIKGYSIYVDGSRVKSVAATKLDTYISASTGKHRLTIQAHDSAGSYFQSTTYPNVGSTSSTSTGSTSTSGGTTFSNIDQKTGWASCTVCAGAGGSGAAARYSMQLGVSSPSMDGHSARFNLGGSTPYSSALWWKQLGANSRLHRFVYDLYFYMKNPSAAQAVEFDVNYATGGKKYIFGTECDIKNTHTWRIYSAATRWRSTGIPCAKPAAYKWHHLVWEFQRTSDNKVKFISVTLNGKKSYVNRVYAPKSSGANEVNVAFQMDGDKYQTDYSVWLDKVTLTYW